MLKATIVFDNRISSGENPVDYIRGTYLTETGKMECKSIKVEHAAGFDKQETVAGGLKGVGLEYFQWVTENNSIPRYLCLYLKEIFTEFMMVVKKR